MHQYNFDLRGEFEIVEAAAHLGTRITDDYAATFASTHPEIRITGLPPVVREPIPEVVVKPEPVAEVQPETVLPEAAQSRFQTRFRRSQFPHQDQTHL